MFSQTHMKDELVFGPSKLRQKQTGVVYTGRACWPSQPDSRVFSDRSEAVRVADEIFYESHRFYAGRGDGLVAEDRGRNICRIYPMFAIAQAGGWYAPKEPNGSTPDATHGLHRVNDKLWMGSNGVGVMVLDLKDRTWSRYDSKDKAIPGDHVGVDFADEDFAFVTRGEFPDALLHIYSVKRDKWLSLKSVPSRLMRGYGTNVSQTVDVQVFVDHRVYAKGEFFPIDWSMMYPHVSWSSGDAAYVVEKDLGRGKTIFTLPKVELEKAFRNL